MSARGRAAVDQQERDTLAEVLMASVLVPGPIRIGRNESLVLTNAEAARAADALLASDWLAAHASGAVREIQGQLDRIAGLLAAYGEAEGTPVDYEFLVQQIGEALSVPSDRGAS